MSMERGTGLAFGLLSRLVNGAKPDGWRLVSERALRRIASGWQDLPSGDVQTYSNSSDVIRPKSSINHQLNVGPLLPQKLVQASAPTLPPLIHPGEGPIRCHPSGSLGGQRWFSQTPFKKPAEVSDGEVVASENLDTASGRQVVPSEGVASALPASQPESIAGEGASSPVQSSPCADPSLNPGREEVSPSFVKEAHFEGERAMNLDGAQFETDISNVSSDHSAEFGAASQIPQSTTLPDPSAVASSSDSSPDHGPSSYELAEETSTEPPKHPPFPAAMPSETPIPPSDLASSRPPPAAADVADLDLPEAADIVPAKLSPDLNQDKNSQSKGTNNSRKAKNGQHAGGNSQTDADQPASQDGWQSKGNTTSTPDSNQVSKSKKGRKQSPGGSKRQTKAEVWPRAAQHSLAHVEYLTSRYGNLEITHPRKAVFAPNFDSRPEGFSFTGFEVVFFGTSSNVPSLWRNMSCTAVRIDKSTFLVDCGDGSLQQLLRGAPFRLGSIDRLFITHMHGDHVHGLAAMLIYLGQRTRGAASQGNAADIRPLHVYGPLGLRHFLRILLSATHAGVDAGYAVHELLPPDEREQRSRRIDEFLLPHHDELPGKDIVCDSDGTWHVFEDVNVVVKAAAIKHTVPCFGYVISEKLKPGRFNKDRAEALNIHKEHFGPLSRGQSQTLPDGRTIHPDDVVGPPRRGRKIVVLGDTCEASSLYRAGWDCDLLVHEATVLQEEEEHDAFQMGHSTASMAGQAARAMEARTLVMTHISPRYQYQANAGVEAARAAFGSERVLVAEDHTRIQVEYQEAHAEQRHVDALLRPQDRELPPEEQWTKVTRRRRS